MPNLWNLALKNASWQPCYWITWRLLHFSRGRKGCAGADKKGIFLPNMQLGLPNNNRRKKILLLGVFFFPNERCKGGLEIDQHVTSARPEPTFGTACNTHCSASTFWVVPSSPFSQCALRREREKKKKDGQSLLGLLCSCYLRRHGELKTWYDSFQPLLPPTTLA